MPDPIWERTPSCPEGIVHEWREFTAQINVHYWPWLKSASKFDRDLYQRTLRIYPKYLEIEVHVLKYLLF